MIGINATFARYGQHGTCSARSKPGGQLQQRILKKPAKTYACLESPHLEPKLMENDENVWVLHSVSPHMGAESKHEKNTVQKTAEN